jgi:putative membrane protein
VQGHLERMSPPQPWQLTLGSRCVEPCFLCVVLAVSVGVAAGLIPGIDEKGGALTLLWIGLLFGLVNAVLGPILHIISLPLTSITPGLFALVVNGILLPATAGLSDNLDVGGFLGTILGALVISIVTAVLGFALRPVLAE